MWIGYTLHSGCLLPSAGLSDWENYYYACSRAFRGKEGEIYLPGLWKDSGEIRDSGEYINIKFMSNQFQGSETSLTEPFNIVMPRPQTQEPKTKGLTLKSHGPPTPPKNQNASIQGRQIQCRKDQMQVSHVEKNMVEQSSTVPNSQSIRST